MIINKKNNDKEYNYIAVKKSNALIAIFLYNPHGERFCLDCFNNFQT